MTVKNLTKSNIFFTLKEPRKIFQKFFSTKSFLLNKSISEICRNFAFNFYSRRVVGIGLLEPDFNPGHKILKTIEKLRKFATIVDHVFLDKAGFFFYQFRYLKV